ncbi:MAG: heparan-alpha-glucosaminide N-acetyltransferase domain-containing protein [Pseudomonadota bacterium]
MVRWITHLCAPTFLFLAGTSLAFTVKKLQIQGKTELSIDRYLLVRGLIIAGFELWISYFVMPKGMFLLQVLYAIGTSYLLILPLRRLPDALALGVSVALMLLLELAAICCAQSSGHTRRCGQRCSSSPVNPNL